MGQTNLLISNFASFFTSLYYDSCFSLYREFFFSSFLSLTVYLINISRKHPEFTQGISNVIFPMFLHSSTAPPLPHISQGLKTEEGNAVCVWMNLKLEAEWQRNRQIIPTPSLCVLVWMRVCVGNGPEGSDEEGSVKKKKQKNFSIWGATAAQTKLQTRSHPRHSPHTHTGAHSHTGDNMLLVPRWRAESSRSSLTALGSVKLSEATRK